MSAVPSAASALVERGKTKKNGEMEVERGGREVGQRKRVMR